jgi:hypothetical protein
MALSRYPPSGREFSFLRPPRALPIAEPHRPAGALRGARAVPRPYSIRSGAKRRNCNIANLALVGIPRFMRHGFQVRACT